MLVKILVSCEQPFEENILAENVQCEGVPMNMVKGYSQCTQG